jgi:cell division protein FtsW
MEWLSSRIKGDIWIWLIVFALSVFSILAVYSSTGALAYQKYEGNTSILLFKHSIMVIAGLVLMYIAHRIDYRYYSGIAKLMLIIAIPLLLYTLFFGANINEAKRWITIPIINQTFQTSDWAKLALIMFLARELTRRQERIKDFKSGFLPIFSSVILVFLLIAPSNLSTALMIFGTSVLILLIGRVSFRQIALVCLAGGLVLTAIVLLGPRRATYKSRINSYFHPEKIDPDKAYQANHAQMAIASGGWFGKGPGHSLERNYLPQAYSDFIFAIIIEEWGLVSGFILIFLYLFLLYRCIKIITRSPKAFGALLATGLSFSLVIQALANMAVATHLLPVTGVSLPLVSMGGTSILFTSMAFGIILSVSREVEKDRNLSQEGGEIAIA